MHFSSVIPNNPSDVIFWTGAGISVDPPSCLPLGPSLTFDVVNTFCLPKTWQTINDYLIKARLEETSGNIKSIPRLEAILGNIVSILGYDILGCFSFLDSPPNDYHHFFAHHIMLGGNHITMNLDLCIENALNRYYVNSNYESITPNILYAKLPNFGDAGWILHLHGKIGKELPSLGLTIDNVSKGINESIRQLIIDTLKSKMIMVFLGYNGGDAFDVDPFFYSLIGHLDFSNKCIIWIDYQKIHSNLDLFKYRNTQLKRSILDSLLRCNAQIYVWHGETKEVVNFLRTIMSLALKM
jgi:hypothetical protein